MILYLVRHGQSESNVSGKVQGPDDALTEQGILQAHALAARVENLEPDAIYTSPFLRTRMTADIIAARVGKSAILHDDLHESMWAERFWGMPRSDPSFAPLLASYSDDETEAEWDATSHETWRTLNERADRVLAFFASQKYESVLAVSHGYFLRFLIRRMLLGDALTVGLSNKTDLQIKISNTGLSVLKYEGGVWQLVTWNDHAHLG
ncbi:MAG: histidine phosphatase family protein [Candidatus Pacebacteria bacterium]|nr:histidine phosphatase family protein [Candidatus Paceibacterota bacterium]